MHNLIAQIGRNPNEDIVTDFLNQLPVSLIFFVCGSSILLFFAFTWFAYFKPLRKSRRQKKTIKASPVAVSASPVSRPMSVVPDDDDLPDLDMLIGQELPANPPAAPGVDAVPPARDPQRMMRVQLNTGLVVRAQEVIAVLRDPRDGRLMVHLNGTAYRTLTDDSVAKAQFVDLMRELNNVVNQPDDNPPPPEELPSVPAYTPDANVPGKLPSFKLEDNMQATNKGIYEVGEVPELNIAAAIEAYLQHKIRQTPEFAHRQLHVQPAPDGGVRIQVDNEYYEAVSDITDNDARLFIQQVIAEWQALNQ